LPSCVPSSVPTSEPSDIPTVVPSSLPSSVPTSLPSAVPSSVPTAVPSQQPSYVPTGEPSGEPTSLPSSVPTSVPTVDSKLTCLYLSTYDLFGDGWQNEAVLSFDVLMSGGSELWKKSGNMSMTCQSSYVSGCLSPTSQHADGTFNLSLHSIMGSESNGMVSHSWEMLWSVQVVSGDDWGDVYYGGIGSELYFMYHADTDSYELLRGEGLLTNESGVNVPLSSESSVSGSGHVSDCAMIELVKYGHSSSSSSSSSSLLSSPYSSSSSSSSMMGVGWYIMDVSSMYEVVAYNSSWLSSTAWSVSDVAVGDVDRMCLRDGSYVLRVTGGMDDISVNVSWSFCNVVGNKQDELYFDMVDGECIRGRFGDVSAVCSDSLTVPPSQVPTSEPSSEPSGQPTSLPSCVPSSVPTSEPSSIPTVIPSSLPSSVPTSLPSAVPSSVPTAVPSQQPSYVPTGEPSGQPTSLPSSVPTSVPTVDSKLTCLYLSTYDLLGDGWQNEAMLSFDVLMSGGSELWKKSGNMSMTC